MTIQVDSREKPKAVKTILKQFDAAGIQHFVSKLPVGDYQSLDNARLVIDRKQSLIELVQNCCQQHDRFRAEMERANKLGIKLVILCEHGQGINTLDDVRSWQNPRLKESPLTMSGERLFKVLLTMSIKYGVEVRFCDKKDTGKEIVRILGGGAL